MFKIKAISHSNESQRLQLTSVRNSFWPASDIQAYLIKEQFINSNLYYELRKNYGTAITENELKLRLGRKLKVLKPYYYTLTHFNISKTICTTERKLI